MLRSWGTSTNIYERYDLALVLVSTPCSDFDAKRLLLYAEPAPEHKHERWRLLVKAAALYRTGQHEKAIELQALCLFPDLFPAKGGD